MLPLSQGIPLKSAIQRLKKKVHHLTKRSKEMDGELRRLRESHSEATTEATRFRNPHVKGIMEYSQRRSEEHTSELSHSGESRMPSSA